MSRCTGRSAQCFIQAKAGFVSVAALLCLSEPVELLAQGAEPTAAPTPPPEPQSESQPQAHPGSAQETPLPPVDVVVRPRPRRSPPAPTTPAPASAPAPQQTTDAPPAVTGYRANTSGIGRLPVPLIDMPQT